jgi:hypothetical protein
VWGLSYARRIRIEGTNGVAVAGDVHEPQLIERWQIQLLPDGAWAPYHAAEGLDLADARKSVRRKASYFAMCSLPARMPVVWK